MCRGKFFRVLFCGMLITMLTFTGCGTQKGKNEIYFSDTSVTGTVESVEENEIVLSVGRNNKMGQMPGDGTPSNQNMSGNKMSQPPEIPQGGQNENQDESRGQGEQQSPPEMPQGEQDKNQDESQGQGEQQSPPEMPNEDSVSVHLIIKDESVLQSEEGKEVSLKEIEEGDVLTVTINKSGKVTKVTVGEEQKDVAVNVENYESLKKFAENENVSGETYMSKGTDENTVHIYNGAKVTLENIEAYRNSDDSSGGDASSFYGIGADLLVSDGAAYVSGGNYTTDAKGGAGIFAYNKGTVYVKDSVIQTEQDTSGGVHVAGGGSLYAWNLDVETQGESSAAIRSDRGGGTMVVDGGSYVSNGTGSPAVYCTADITANNAELTANGSEAVCIEGLNTLRLYDCDLTGNMSDNEQNDCTWNVIVYQSMSGDSEVGNSTFHMVGGSLAAGNGGMFYTTNTECTMLLSDVDITYSDNNAFFLRCTGNTNARGWGQTGSNGSQCNFTADSQKMLGNIIYDSISTLDFYMTNGSTLTGAVVDDESCAGTGGNGYCNLYISADSTWTVTGDSTTTEIHNEGTIIDGEGKQVSIVGKDGTVYVKGDSQYTITTSVYDTTADMSGAQAAGTFADYQVEQPEELL